MIYSVCSIQELDATQRGAVCSVMRSRSCSHSDCAAVSLWSRSSSDSHGVIKKTGTTHILNIYPSSTGYVSTMLRFTLTPRSCRVLSDLSATVRLHWSRWRLRVWLKGISVVAARKGQAVLRFLISKIVSVGSGTESPTSAWKQLHLSVIP